MQTEIRDYDPETRAVPVVFTAGGVIHERSVNACHDANGDYDATATTARVADVARGVSRKIEVGAIVNPPVIELPEAIEPEAEPAAGDA